MAKKVLIIDDDPEFRFISRRILEGIGLQVLESEKLDEAYKEIEKSLPNLIILDLHLTEEESGLTFLEWSKKEKRLESVPIIVCSAQSLKKVIYKVYTLGVSEFMTKPIKSNLLIQKVKKLLRDAPPLTYQFKEGEEPLVHVKVDAEATHMNDLEVKIASPCKMSKGMGVKCEIDILKKHGINCSKLESSNMSMNKEVGLYETVFKYIGFSERDASKIRGLKNTWKVND